MVENVCVFATGVEEHIREKWHLAKSRESYLFSRGAATFGRRSAAEHFAVAP